MMRILCVFVFAVSLFVAGCAALPAAEAPEETPEETREEAPGHAPAQAQAPSPPLRQSPSPSPSSSSAPVPIPAEPLPVDPAVPAFLARLEARDAGVDRAGHLWAWDAGEVRVHAASGEVVAVLPVPQETAAVDADREWGLAALATGGRELRWARPGGETSRLRLPEEAADAAWVSAGEVAVSPVAGRHRVEIWNLERGERMAAFGAETPVVPPETGTYLVRTVLLDHDAERGRLWSLDSFTGDLRVFDAEGRQVARGALHNPRRAEIERSVREPAQPAHQGPASPARYEMLRLAVDEAGTGRVVTACRDDRRAATVFTFPLDGKAGEQTIELARPCCSRVFTTWRGWLVLYDSPRVPGPECTAVERLGNGG